MSDFSKLRVPFARHRKKNGHLRARSCIHDPLGIHIQVCRVSSSPKQTISLHFLSARAGRRPVGTKRIRQRNFFIKKPLLGQ